MFQLVLRNQFDKLQEELVHCLNVFTGESYCWIFNFVYNIVLYQYDYKLFASSLIQQLDNALPHLFVGGLIYVICVCLCIVVSNTYCVVFLFLFFFVLCTLYCQFLWIVHFYCPIAVL